MSTKHFAHSSQPRVTLEHVWLLIPVALVTWMGFMHPLRKLDFWWQLKAGEIIASERYIPRLDIFSFTQAGQPFILYNWLGDIIYYVLYRAGGLPLLVAFNTVLLVTALWFVYRLSLETNANRRLVSLCMLVAALVLGLYSNVRTQAFSFAFFAAFLWILWGFRNGRRDELWALPVLMVPWVNLHGAYILGLGVIGLMLATETARWLSPRTRPEALAPRALLKLAAVLGLTALATLANPETWRVYDYVWQLQIDPASQSFVTEWQPPSIRQTADVLTFFGPFFIILVGLMYGRRPDLTELGFFLAFAVFGLGSTRNGIWLALVGTPLLAQQVASFATVPRRRAELGRLNVLLVIGLLFVTVLLSPWVRPRLGAPMVRPDLLEAGTPVGAMDFIADHDLAGHIFHPQDYGDYLIWRLWPRQRSFFDGRVHLYSADFVRTYFEALQSDDWEAVLAPFDIRYLLLPKPDPLAAQPSASLAERAAAAPNWVVLYEDDVSVLFARQP